MRTKRHGCTAYKAQKGRSPALVFLHGWGSNHTVWMPYFKHFKDHTIVALDFRGHGQSKKGPITIENLAEDVHKILKKENIATPHVIGHSLGAAVGLELTKKRRLKSLTTINLFTRRYAFARPFVHAAVRFGSSIIQNARRTEFQYYYHENEEPVTNTLKLDIKGTSKDMLWQAYKAIHGYEVNWSTHCPTLLIQGAYDPMAWNQRLRNDTRNQDHVTLKILPCHHNISTHKPQKVISALEEFWS